MSKKITRTGKLSKEGLMITAINNMGETRRILKAMDYCMCTYEDYLKLSQRPGREQAAGSKYGLVLVRAEILCGIVCDVQKKTGVPIITGFLNGKEEMLQFARELDYVFSDELYAEKFMNA